MARKPYVPIEDISTCDPVNQETTNLPRQTRDVEDSGSDHVEYHQMMVSSAKGNSARLLADGVFMPAIVYRENTDVEPSGDGLTVIEGETEDGFRQFQIGIRVSGTEGNILTIDENGIGAYIPEGSEESALVYQGGLGVYLSTPNQASVLLENERCFIMVPDGINRIILGEEPTFTEFQELFLVQGHQSPEPFVLYWPANVFVDGQEGPHERTFAGGSSVHLLRQSGQNWLTLAGSGPNEAPFTDTSYVRRNGEWVSLQSEVFPVLVPETPVPVAPLVVDESQFNHIVDMDPVYSGLELKRQFIVPYQDHYEATFIQDDGYQLTYPMGVTINGIAGPGTWTVDAKPKGAVLKKVSNDNWLLLGSTAHGDELIPLPEITLLEFPGSGTFFSTVQLIDGTVLYDMTGNVNLQDTANNLKNLIIAMIIYDQKESVINNKDVAFLTSDASGLATLPTSGLATGDNISWRDAIKFLLTGSYDDIAYMTARLIGTELNIDAQGADGFERFTIAMNDKIASVEGIDSLSVAMGAAVNIASPTISTNVYQLVKWLAHLENNYPDIVSDLRDTSTDVSVFGSNARTLTLETTNTFNGWPLLDTGKASEYLDTDTSQGLLHKYEMPLQIPVFVAALNFTTEFEQFMCMSSMHMHLEDDFPFLSGSDLDEDLSFGNVVFLVGDTDTLFDQSINAHHITSAPLGVTITERTGKAWGWGYELNGTNNQGTLTVPNHIDFDMGAGDFTIELYLRGNSTKFRHTIFAKSHETVSNYGLWLGWNNMDDLVLRYSMDGNSHTLLSFTVPGGQAFFYNGARRHVAIQRNGDEIGLFLNGRQVAMATGLGVNALATNTMPFVIGADGNPTGTPDPRINENGPFILDQARVTKGLCRYDFAGFNPDTRPLKDLEGA